jgi:hypothetical protein
MDIEKTFAVQVLDTLPMLLSADPGMVLEEVSLPMIKWIWTSRLSKNG